MPETDDVSPLKKDTKDRSSLFEGLRASYFHSSPATHGMDFWSGETMSFPGQGLRYHRGPGFRTDYHITDIKGERSLLIHESGIETNTARPTGANHLIAIPLIEFQKQPGLFQQITGMSIEQANVASQKNRSSMIRQGEVVPEASDSYKQTRAAIEKIKEAPGGQSAKIGEQAFVPPRPKNPNTVTQDYQRPSPPPSSGDTYALRREDYQTGSKPYTGIEISETPAAPSKVSTTAPPSPSIEVDLDAGLRDLSRDMRTAEALPDPTKPLQRGAFRPSRVFAEAANTPATDANVKVNWDNDAFTDMKFHFSHASPLRGGDMTGPGMAVGGSLKQPPRSLDRYDPPKGAIADQTKSFYYLTELNEKPAGANYVIKEPAVIIHESGAMRDFDGRYKRAHHTMVIPLSEFDGKPEMFKNITGMDLNAARTIVDRQPSRNGIKTTYKIGESAAHSPSEAMLKTNRAAGESALSGRHRVYREDVHMPTADDMDSITLTNKNQTINKPAPKPAPVKADPMADTQTISMADTQEMKTRSAWDGFESKAGMNAQGKMHIEMGVHANHAFPEAELEYLKEELLKKGVNSYQKDGKIIIEGSDAVRAYKDLEIGKGQLRFNADVSNGVALSDVTRSQNWKTKISEGGELQTYVAREDVSDFKAVVKDLQANGLDVRKFTDVDGKEYLLMSGESARKGFDSKIMQKVPVAATPTMEEMKSRPPSPARTRAQEAQLARENALNTPPVQEPKPVNRIAEPVADGWEGGSKLAPAHAELAVAATVPSSPNLHTVSISNETGVVPGHAHYGHTSGSMFPDDFKGFDDVPDAPPKPALNIEPDPVVKPSAAHPHANKMAGAAGVAMSAMGMYGAMQSGDNVQMGLSGTDMAVSTADMALDYVDDVSRVGAFKSVAAKGNIVITVADGLYQISKEEGALHKTQRGVAVAAGAGATMGAAALTTSAIATAGIGTAAVTVGAPIVAAVAAGYGAAVISETTIETMRLYEEEAKRFNADFNNLQHAKAVRPLLGKELVSELKKLDGVKETPTFDEKAGEYRQALVMKDGTTLFIGMDGGLTNASDLDMSNPDYFNALNKALDTKLASAQAKVDETSTWLWYGDKVDANNIAHTQLKVLQSAKTEINSAEYQRLAAGSKARLDDLKTKIHDQITADSKDAAGKPVPAASENFNYHAAAPIASDQPTLTAHSNKHFHAPGLSANGRMDYYAMKDGQLVLQNGPALHATLGTKDINFSKTQDGHYWAHAQGDMEKGAIVLAQDLPETIRKQIDQSLKADQPATVMPEREMMASNTASASLKTLPA